MRFHVSTKYTVGTKVQFFKIFKIFPQSWNHKWTSTYHYFDTLYKRSTGRQILESKISRHRGNNLKINGKTFWRLIFQITPLDWMRDILQLVIELQLHCTFRRIAQTLIKLGACQGWSESSLGSFCRGPIMNIKNLFNTMPLDQIHFAKKMFKTDKYPWLLYWGIEIWNRGNVNLVKGSSIWASTRETCLRGFANNTGADQPAHPRSLISAFVVRFLESSIC